MCQKHKLQTPLQQAWLPKKQQRLCQQMVPKPIVWKYNAYHATHKWLVKSKQREKNHILSFMHLHCLKFNVFLENKWLILGSWWLYAKLQYATSLVGDCGDNTWVVVYLGLSLCLNSVLVSHSKKKKPTQDQIKRCTVKRCFRVLYPAWYIQKPSNWLNITNFID